MYLPCRRLFLVPLFGLLLLAGSSCESQNPVKRADKQMEALRTRLRAVSLGVAVVKDNRIVYTGSFGVKNTHSGEILREDHIFRIASISKSFTATAVMQLCEQGKIALDDDVSPYLGFSLRNPHHPDVPITFRMLLSHTSGLRDAAGYFSLDVINPAVTPDVSGSFHDYKPGTAWDYCNLGFNTLGSLIEKISGERFDRYIRRHITDPLGMHASFNVEDFDPAEFVSLYEFENGQFVESTDAYLSRAKDTTAYVLGYSAPLYSPTGGMKLAPKDLAKHILVQMNAGSYQGVKILDPESVTAMQTPQSAGEEPKESFPETGYGFALRRVNTLIPGEIMTGHTGGAYGLASAMFFNPEKHFGFVMMTSGYDTGIPREPNGFSAIQSQVINALYRIFIIGK